MKVAILTLYTPNIKDYGSLSEINKKEYAKNHGYDFWVCRKSLNKNRAPAWSKIIMIKKFLSKYDWIFWTDADSLIMNMDFCLEDIIKKYPGKFMILTKGVSSPINSGQWLIKNTKWSNVLLDKIWTKTPKYFIKNNPWEQGSFVKLLDKSIWPKLAIVKHRAMNSVPNIKYINLACSRLLNREKVAEMEYRPGDFIVHFMFSKNPKKRLAGMKYYFKKIKTK